MVPHWRDDQPATVCWNGKTVRHRLCSEFCRRSTAGDCQGQRACLANRSSLCLVHRSRTEPRSSHYWSGCLPTQLESCLLQCTTPARHPGHIGEWKVVV